MPDNRQTPLVQIDHLHWIDLLGENSFHGSNGDDLANGLWGDDFIHLHGGNDTAYGGTGNDVIFGGDGADALYGGNDKDTLRGGQGDDECFGGSGNDDLKGEAGNDALFGGTGSDSLEGGTGADVLDGGLGFDWAVYLHEDAGVSVDLSIGQGLAGAAAGDTYTSIEAVKGSGYGDVIIGSAGNNRLDGAKGDDTIDGGAGDDVIIGGENQEPAPNGMGDLMTGGLGADMFYFFFGDSGGGGDSGPDMDVITDFNPGEDYLIFHALDAADPVFSGHQTEFQTEGPEVFYTQTTDAAFGDVTIVSVNAFAVPGTVWEVMLLGHLELMESDLNLL